MAPMEIRSKPCNQGGVAASPFCMTALQRKSYLCISSKDLRGFCERFINFQDRSTYFPAAEKEDWLLDTYINRPRTYECGNRDWGRAIPFLGEYLFRIFVIVSLQCVLSLLWICIITRIRPWRAWTQVPRPGSGCGDSLASFSVVRG